jgi:protein-tyrosine-phosphatase/N-acetylglutamate synthase-like GNAT family acetyltransferase
MLWGAGTGCPAVQDPRGLLLMEPVLRELHPASPGWDGFVAVLANAGLPVEDVREPGQRFFALIDGGEPVAHGGIAPFGDEVLLRSLAVPARLRGQRHGSRMLGRLLEEARSAGAARAWLLTQVPGFFTAHGFEARRRSECPRAIATSREFSSLCPVTATLMSRTMTTPQPLNVLFLCTHNSARSILAEATLNHLGRGRFRGWSAGSSPRENQQPNPLALAALQEAGYPIEGLRSKAWDEFAAPGAPEMDLIITVCDNAAGEACPVWPGHPATAHWGYPDPSEVQGSEEQRRAAFRGTLQAIRQRIEMLIALPPERLDKLRLQQSARGLAG